MSLADEQEVAQRIVDTLHDAFKQGTRGLCIVRCANNSVVDAARETLRRTGAPFTWRSLPIAELSPPDLATFLGMKGNAQGPAFLAYGLPLDHTGQVLPEFLELLQRNAREYGRHTSLAVLVLTLQEMRAVAGGAPSFWALRSSIGAWPTSADPSRFVPARTNSGLAAQAFGGVAAQARGGVAAQARGGVAAQAHGGVAAQAQGGVASQVAGGVAAQVEGGITTQRVGNVEVVSVNIALHPDAGPWSGAPLQEDGEVPEYVTKSDAPAGRRWGISLAPDDPDGAALIDKGRSFLDAVQVEQARQCLSKAARHFKDAANDRARAECYVMLGRAAEMRIDFTVAFDWYKLAMGLHELHGDGAGYSDCCGFIGYMHFMQGDPSGAKRCIELGLEKDRLREDELRIAAGSRRLGVISEVQKEYKEAEAYYTKAGRVESEIGDQYSYSRSLNHLARIYRIQSRIDEAQEALEKSIAIKQELEDEPGLASGLHELGNLCLQAKDYDDALGYYEEALELEVRLRDIPGIAATQAQIGLTSKFLLNFPKCIESLMISRALFRKLDSPNVAAIDKVINGVRTMVEDRDLKIANEVTEEFIQRLLYAYET
jgi:tetratricopeptide (TPR) repeat protein